MVDGVRGEVQSFGSVDADSVAELQESLERRLHDVRSLESAARVFVDAIASRFGPSTVLVRLYATIAHGSLSERERTFANNLARARQVRVQPDDTTLVLMGSRGHEPAWNDRCASEGHLAIPLVDQSFIAGIPMLASLIESIGARLSWFDAPASSLARRLVGGFNGVFFVEDATTARDDQGRYIIPARDFIEEHGVRTVFGAGGSTAFGTIVTFVIFTNEALTRSQAERFSALLTVMKIATMSLASKKQLFDRDQPTVAD